jgi:hypothetical protein
LFWNETGERKIFSPNILKKAKEQVRKVRENLQVAQSRQKSYASHRRRELSFDVGDFVYLKVFAMRGLCRFKVRSKLASRLIGPFKILEKRREVAYQLELPPQLSNVPEEQIPMEDLDANEDLSYQEYPIKILETSERVTWNKKIKMCKVQQSHHTEEEATWVGEEELKAEFPSCFSDLTESRRQDSF